MRTSIVASCLLALMTNAFKTGSILKERIYSKKSKFACLNVDTTDNGSKNENDRVASHESLSIHINRI